MSYTFLLKSHKMDTYNFHLQEHSQIALATYKGDRDLQPFWQAPVNPVKQNSTF